MTKNPVLALNELHRQFMEGTLDRRTLLRRASTLGLAASALAAYSAALPASAQDATPQAAVLPGGYKSMTREEYKAQLATDYPFTANNANAAKGGTVILGDTSTANLTTVNPMFADNFPTQDVVFLMFEQLVGLYPKGGAIFTPGLADYYEIAEDGKTYTFHMNPGAMFHDGTPLTAADVAFTCDAVANEATGTSYTSSFNSTIASYRAVDDHTFEVVTHDVIAQIVFFPNFFAPVIAKHVWESIPVEQWKADPGSTGLDGSRVVGSGPFKFDSLSESEGTTTLLANDTYWDGPPNIAKVIFQVWPDDTAIVEALKGGDLDVYMESVPPADTASLQEEPNLDVAIFDTYKFGWYGYNLDPAHTPLFQDVRVRQALIIAADRKSIIDNIYLGYATFPIGTQPTLSEAFTQEGIDNLYEYDPEKAKAMLDEAGWVLNGDVREKDGVKLSFDLMYAPSTTNDATAAALQDYWKAVGVDGKPNPVDFDTVMTPALTETFDFRVIMLGFNWASPSGDQSAMFGTASYGGGFNAMKYSNPEYDKLNDEANKELIPEKRRELLIKATNIVNNDAPVCILNFRKDRIGYNVKVKNFTPTANSLLWTLPFVEAAG